MSIGRSAGRRSGDGLGFPPGCSGLATCALSRCTAETRGRECLLCLREGIHPAPTQWDEGPGWLIAAPMSVQAVKFKPRGPANWAVVVFVQGRKVHGKYPVILCDTKERAIRLMFDRAWQIDQSCPVPFGSDGETWKTRDLYLAVAEPRG